MRRTFKAIVVGLIFLTIAGVETTDAVRVVPQRKPIAHGRVLIVSGTSDLEADVVAKLTKLLQADGSIVRRIPVTEVQKFHPDSFDATVLMSAVAKDSLKKPMLDFLSLYSHKNEPTTVIVAKITGEEWHEKELAVDAVSGASTKTEPIEIAQRLRTNITSILSRAARVTH